MNCSSLPVLKWAEELQLPAHKETVAHNPRTPNPLSMNGSGAVLRPLVVLECARRIDLRWEHRWLLRHNAVQNHSEEK